jgi:hypothetical protein
VGVPLPWHIAMCVNMLYLILVSWPRSGAEKLTIPFEEDPRRPAGRGKQDSKKPNEGWKNKLSLIVGTDEKIERSSHDRPLA